jgi:hypothetical protein
VFRTVKTSGTINQPIGNQQIVECAAARIHQAKRYSFSQTLLVAIESGLVPVPSRDGIWQEVTCIAVAKEDSPIEIMWALGPILDDPRFAPHLQKVLAAKGEITLGELLHQEDPSIPADAWYNRQALIEEALLVCLNSH